MNNFIELTPSRVRKTVRKLVYGFGINDADYVVERNVNGIRERCPYYAKWFAMVVRCYDPKFHKRHPSYKDCTVCKEWKYFSNFKAWMMTQDWEGKELDKDILVLGNRQYSPQKCIFVSSEVNNLFNVNHSSKSKYLIGVCKHKNNKKFEASYSNKNVYIHLGSFESEIEAHNKYLEYRKQYIISIANKQTDIRIKEALINRANNIHYLE